ncbi:chemotaxis protein CheW [Deferrisoma sp.]
MVSNILTEVGTNELEVVEFLVDGTAYAINVAKVREIVNPGPTTPLPEAHACVKGLFRNRDEVFPLIDLGAWLGVASPQDTRRSKVIVCEFNRRRVGLWVHGVSRIHRLSWADMEPLSGTTLTGSRAVVGLLRLGENRERLVLMLDFERITSEVLPEDEAEARTAPDERRRGRSILVAEDSAMVRKLLVDRLGGAGYRVTAVPDGQAAWEALEAQTPPDLVITDIEMPRMDGHHLLRRIRAHEALGDLPVVLYSSMIHEEMRRKGEALGATAQLCKPDLPHLVEAVDRILFG